MDLNTITQQRQRLESAATEKIQDAINGMREDLSKTNEYVSQQLQQTKKEEEAPSSSSTPPLAAKRLIYFSYPIAGYEEQPQWVDPLRHILIQAGYLIYNPWDKIDAQFGQQDLPHLNQAHQKVVKSICPLLQIPEEVLLPFDNVWKIIQKGDVGDHFGVVFKSLWFLSRSSLVVCDLMRPSNDACVAQEVLYSKQLQIPVIGLLPPSGQLDPFIHRSTTALFSGADFLSLLPMIKGYAE